MTRQEHGEGLAGQITGVEGVERVEGEDFRPMGFWGTIGRAAVIVAFAAVLTKLVATAVLAMFGQHAAPDLHFYVAMWLIGTCFATWLLRPYTLRLCFRDREEFFRLLDSTLAQKNYRANGATDGPVCYWYRGRRRVLGIRGFPVIVEIRDDSAEILGTWLSLNSLYSAVPPELRA